MRMCWLPKAETIYRGRKRENKQIYFTCVWEGKKWGGEKKKKKGKGRKGHAEYLHHDYPPIYTRVSHADSKRKSDLGPACEKVSERKGRKKKKREKKKKRKGKDEKRG